MGLTLKFSSVIEMYWLEITQVTKTSLGLSFPLCKMETETPRSHTSEDEMRWRAPQRASTEQTLPSEWVFPTDCRPTRKLLELLVTQYPRPFLERRASIHPPPQLTGQRRAGSTNHILSSWTVDLGLRSRRRPCGRGSWGGGGCPTRLVLRKKVGKTQQRAGIHSRALAPKSWFLNHQEFCERNLLTQPLLKIKLGKLTDE